VERLLAHLNDAQRAAAQVNSGPLVILAGAGTGKTRVISRRASGSRALRASMAWQPEPVDELEKPPIEGGSERVAEGI